MATESILQLPLDPPSELNSLGVIIY